MTGPKRPETALKPLWNRSETASCTPSLRHIAIAHRWAWEVFPQHTQSRTTCVLSFSCACVFSHDAVSNSTTAAACRDRHVIFFRSLNPIWRNQLARAEELLFLPLAACPARGCRGNHWRVRTQFYENMSSILWEHVQGPQICFSVTGTFQQLEGSRRWNIVTQCGKHLFSGNSPLLLLGVAFLHSCAASFLLMEKSFGSRLLVPRHGSYS